MVIEPQRATTCWGDMATSVQGPIHLRSADPEGEGEDEDED
jgi:hypothetical protein